MEGCHDAVPCWIMPSWRVSEQLPAALGSFDLVIMDEASLDAREIPTLLRGKKVLVVGDDRQVRPQRRVSFDRERAAFGPEFSCGISIPVRG
jgi:superfamily I DNA and/or RNA helicase